MTVLDILSALMLSTCGAKGSVMSHDSQTDPLDVPLHLRLAIENMYCLFPDIYISHNKLTLRHKNGIYLCSSKNQKVKLKIQWILLFHSAPLS